MSSCRECRWWTQGWRDLHDDEGACMVARTEPDKDGIARTIISDTPMRAVGNHGHVAGSLFTRGGFLCALFAPR